MPHWCRSWVQNNSHSEIGSSNSLTLHCCKRNLPTGGRDGSTCLAACLNGGTCSGSKCVCRPGYQGEFCGERKCIIMYT